MPKCVLLFVSALDFLIAKTFRWCYTLIWLYHATNLWNPNLFEFLGPWLLSFAEAVFGLFRFFEAANHLFVVGVFLPVLQLFVVFSHQSRLHLHVELAHLLCLCADGCPCALQSAVLRAWGDESPLVNLWLNSKNFHNLFSNLFLWVASSAFPTRSAAVRKPSQYVPARVCSSSVHCRGGCHHLPVSPISCSYRPENKQWSTIIEINIILTCCDLNLRARLTSQKLSLETSIMESS